jgi:hypothetical protein
MASALRAGTSPVAGRSLIELLRHLDVALVVLAVPVALALGAPALGLLIAVGGWLVQRVLAHTDRRWIARAREPRTQLGLNLAEAFGRIWLLAGAIIVAGVVGGRADGLTAGLVICGAYSVAFATKVISGPRTSPRSAAAPRRAQR